MELANELYARSLISEDMKDWVETARGVSAGDMASRMLSNVEATLRAAPQALEVITAFFEVIWWAEHTLSHVLKEMEEELQQEPWVSVKRDVLEELIVLESKHATMVMSVTETFRDDVYHLKVHLAFSLHDEKFSDCESEVVKVFILLQAYISTFNNSVLKVTVKSLDKQPALRSIEEYEEEKLQFLQSTTVREFQVAIEERPKPEQPDDQELIELKIPDRDGTWPDRTLKDLLDLVNEVCGMHGRETVMISTAGNSLGIHTYTPRNKVEEVRAHIRTKWELLERLGATVSIGGDTVQLIHPPDPFPWLKPSIQRWLSKRNATISALEQLATDMENYNQRNETAGDTFQHATVAGIAVGALGILAAPFTFGTSLVVTAGAITATSVTGLGSAIYAATNFRPKVNAAQQAIDEDLEESRRLNRMLRDAGQNEQVNKRDLTLNLRKDTPTVDQLRSIANRLRHGRSKADMEELLNTLQ